MKLATDFPMLWQDKRTPSRGRRRMVRLLIEDVTLVKSRHITVQIRFRGGTTRTLIVPIPLNAWQARQTSDRVVTQIDGLLNDGTDDQIATRLNHLGLRSGNKRPFNAHIVARIRKTYGLKSRRDRLREAGMLTVDQIAHQLGVCTTTVKIWRDDGMLKAHPYNDKNQCLYEPVGDNGPVKSQGRKLSERRTSQAVLPNRTYEVQHAM